jgi:hypothetical protein
VGLVEDQYGVGAFGFLGGEQVTGLRIRLAFEEAGTPPRWRTTWVWPRSSIMAGQVDDAGTGGIYLLCHRPIDAADPAGW